MIFVHMQCVATQVKSHKQDCVPRRVRIMEIPQLLFASQNVMTEYGAEIHHED